MHIFNPIFFVDFGQATAKLGSLHIEPRAGTCRLDIDTPCQF
jgi:hypothetical protein